MVKSFVHNYFPFYTAARHMSRFMRNPLFEMRKTKTQTCAGNCAADQHLCLNYTDIPTTPLAKSEKSYLLPLFSSRKLVTGNAKVDHRKYFKLFYIDHHWWSI